MNCRSCGSINGNTVVDLGDTPPSNSYLNKEDLDKEEKKYPLKLWFCENCFLLQTVDFVNRETMFSPNYAYLSSASKSWLNHCENYVDEITSELQLTSKSLVVEIASNDGYLLQYFQNKQIPCIGIEPTYSTAAKAREKGIQTRIEFFGMETANKLRKEKGTADLIIGNNVLAHVPDLNDFVKGVKNILAPKGTATFEFPHLLNLIKMNAFDTVYHEHYSYLSILSLSVLLARYSLQIYKIRKITTHGGSLRIYIKHESNKVLEIQNNVNDLIKEERNYGLNQIATMRKIQTSAELIRQSMNNYLNEAKKRGLKIAAFGAAAKGMTLVNFSKVNKNEISMIADSAESKIGKFAPGSHIPIVDIDTLKNFKPSSVVIFPWNLIEEIRFLLKSELNYQFEIVTFVPEIKIELVN